MSNKPFNITYELDKIMELNRNNKLAYYDFFDWNIKDQQTLVSCLINQINNSPVVYHNKNINFKKSYYYNLLEFIINNVNAIYKDPSTNENIKIEFDKLLGSIILEKISLLDKGQHLLYKIKHRINKLVLDGTIKNTELFFSNLIVSISRSGTLPTFLFWIERNKKNIEDYDSSFHRSIFINAMANSDDRLFKYLLDKMISIDKLFFQKNGNLINEMLIALAESLVPPKYMAKRIKILSNYISLIPYFHHMVSIFKNTSLILKLHKYYYVQPHNIQSLWDLMEMNTHRQETINTIMNLLKTNEEKILLNIITSCRYFDNNNYVNLNDNNNFTSSIEFKRIIQDNYKFILDGIYFDDFLRFLNPINSQILKTLTENNLITRYALNHSQQIGFINPRFFLFTKFLAFDIINKDGPHQARIIKKIISINYLLHLLRMFIRRKKKCKVISYRVKMFDILNEIKNYTPKRTIPVLKNGSVNYQYHKQKFTNLPPRHLLPCELSIYKNFLLKEKADGILINNLPTGIYPYNDLIKNYQVKAEYIEDLDLYLVFDIDIPNTTILERYNIMRNAHPYTSNSYLHKIEYMDEFYDILNKEKNNINKFLNNNGNHTIKWYPKFSCLVENPSKKLYNEIIDIITDKDTTIKNSGLYNCDGLILTPIDGSREIKIKPKSLMTIDLIFNSRKWLDREGNDWSSYIIENTIPKSLKDSRIYRCYPFENKFKVGEYRYDKHRPNPYNVVSCIINILKYNWSEEFKEQSYYYDKKVKLTNKNLINTIREQNNLLEKRLNDLEPSPGKNWLDLGCGKGKLVPLIKKYNPKNYLGLDIDIKQLVQALKYHDQNQDIYLFSPCNLGEDWSDNKIRWFEPNLKYDYIVANFSLAHFYTDKFWEQLNKVCHSETKFLFNLVSPPENFNGWQSSNSFLKIDNDITSYKFEWTHNEIKNEPFINKELLDNYLEKYNWKIKKEIKPKTQYPLINLYCWWIVEKY
jgi:SAM-dependent methyltransferase